MKKFIILFLQYLYKKRVIKQCASFQESLKVNKFSTVNNKTILKENCNINGLVIKGNGEVLIEKNFHSGEGCLFLTSIHNYDKGKSIPYDNININKNILIEENVWLGDRIIILGGVTIGEGAIIQAGSVVVMDIPKYGIAGGHPAKVFKYRDIKHYKKLKEEGKYH